MNGLQQGPRNGNDGPSIAFSLLIAIVHPPEEPVVVNGDPRILDQDPADQNVSLSSHTPVPQGFSGLMGPGDEADVAGEVFGITEAGHIPELQDQERRREKADPRDAFQE